MRNSLFLKCCFVALAFPKFLSSNLWQTPHPLSPTPSHLTPSHPPPPTLPSCESLSSLECKHHTELQIGNPRSSEGAQLTYWLCKKHEDLSSRPPGSMNKPGMMMFICNPGAGGGGKWISGPPRPASLAEIVRSRFSRRLTQNIRLITS